MCTGGGEKGLGERRLILKFTGVHISPFDSYKCCKYHLPIILGSHEFEVQSFKYSIYPLYASCTFPLAIYGQGECTIHESH